MPICEADPWRFQYFEGVDCPADILIPTEDSDAWMWNPAHRWVYDKLAVAQSQGIACGPHGTAPPAFPVFSKPIVNLRGMSVGSRVIADAAAYERAYTPGHLWMTLMEGEHVSTDMAVEDGRVRWRRHATGIPGPGGTFDHWQIHAAPRPAHEAYLDAWVARTLAGYSGIVNVEAIGGRIIEAHLRFSDQWPDLYGAGWVEALVRLYRDGRWHFDDTARRDGFSVVLFGPHGRQWRHPPAETVRQVRAMPGVSSVQITFHEDRPPEAHAMPPGGFRLAIVNAVGLEEGRAARAVLARAFGVAA
jgi:hypothetical protein